MTDTVSIFISTPEMVHWKLFNEYYEPFTVMLNAGVFSIKNGSVALHFDHSGTLQTIQRADTLYSRKHISSSL